MKLLLIEDDKVDQMAFKRLVKNDKLHYDFSIAGSVSEAREILAKEQFEIVIMDYLLGDGTAFDVFSCIKNTPIIFISGAGDEEIAVKAMKLGAYDYLIKDPDRNYLKVLPVNIEKAGKQKKAERQFQILSHAIMSINDSVFITNIDNRIIFVNKVFCTTYGYSEEEIKGRHSRVLWADESAYDRLINSLSSTGQEGWKDELYHKRNDGSEFPVYLTISAIADERGGEAAFVVVTRDITDRKKVEEHLRKAKEEAEEANVAKSDFLANMSHEIRTPMNAIIGMTDLTLDTILTKDQREYLDIVKESAMSLLSLLNSILDFSKIEAGKLELETIAFDLRYTLESAVGTLAVQADRKGIDLLCHIDPKAPNELGGDPGRLRQIIMNLLGNAIKFTDKGEVLLKVSLADVAKDDIDGKVKINFFVRDTGIGIPGDKLNKIFESFTQEDTSTTRKYGGSGLGLTISNRLVKMMGGEIEAVSTVGEGSSFHFTLLLDHVKSSAQDRVTQQGALHGMECMILVSNQLNGQIIKEMLTEMGGNVNVLENSEELLSELMRGFESGRQCELLILDCRLNGADGFRIVDRIKKSCQKQPGIIMLFNTNHRRGDLNKCHEAGLSDCLMKPVKRDALFKAVGKILKQGGKKQSDCPNNSVYPKAGANKGRRVLIVDDDKNNLRLLMEILRKAGYFVKPLKSAQAAVDILKHENFDVVLMDIQMPGMDGIEATEMIRNSKNGVKNPDIPIIAVTAKVIKGDRERYLASGMVDVISKPLDSEKLLASVKRFTEAASDTGVEKANNDDDSQERLPRLEGDIFNRDAALMSFDGNVTALNESFKSFIKDSSSMLDSVKSALDVEDEVALEERLISLKEAAAGIGGHLLRDEAFRMVLASRKGRFDDCRILYKRLESHLLSLVKEMESFDR